MLPEHYRKFPSESLQRYSFPRKPVVIPSHPINPPPYVPCLEVFSRNNEKIHYFHRKPGELRWLPILVVPVCSILISDLLFSAQIIIVHHSCLLLAR